MLTRIGCAAAVLSCLCAASIEAQTWDGGGADNDWTTVANWVGDVAPVNDGTANITMAGTLDPNPNVNVAQDILSLTFASTAASFSIFGAGPLTIRTGGITNNDTDFQSIQVPIILQAPQTWNAASGRLGISLGGTTTNGFALTIDGAFETSFSGVISGSGSLTKNGSGGLRFFAANTYTGGTTINAGFIVTNGDNVLPNTGSITLNGSGLLFIGSFTNTMGALISSSPATEVNLVTTSSLTVGNGGDSSTFNGQVTGDPTATLTKTGAGTLTLGGSNSFAGTYRVTAGTLLLSASERLADTADLVIEGGTFDAQGFTETVDVVTLTSGTISNSGGGAVIASAFNLESGTIIANLGGSAALNKTTAGTVTLTRFSSYTGATNINAGTLRISPNNNVLPDTTNVTVSSGATLALGQFITSTSDTIGGLNGSGNVTLNLSSVLTVGGGNASSSFSGVISGGGSLAKTGTGTLTLSGANTFVGSATISSGTLALGANDTLPNSPHVDIASAGTLALNGFSDTIGGLQGLGNVSLGSGTLTVGASNFASSFSGVISGAGGLSKIGASSFTLSGANTYTGTTTVSAGTLQVNASERLANSSDLFVAGGQFHLSSTLMTETVDVVTLSSGSITGVNVSSVLIGSTYNVESGSISASLGGTGNLIKTTAGTVTLSVANTYTGTTQVVDGTLALGANNVFPDAAMVIVSGGLLNLAGFSDTIGTLGGPANVALGSGTLTIGGNNFSSVFAGVISGSGNLNKIGTGAVTLSGANSYSGLTTASAGTLALGASGVLADASDLTVSGGTFDLQAFNDTVDVVTLISGSITGAGTLTANSYVVHSGTISANLGGSTAMAKLSSGTVTLSGNNSFSGGVSLSAGVLEAGNDANLGAAGGSLNFSGGTLRTTNSFTINRPIALNVGGGTIDTVATTSVTGTISGTGGLTKAGLGTLILNTSSPSLAALTISAGDLELPVGGSLNVTGTATIGASGFFSVDGGLIIAGSFANSGQIELLNNARLVGPVSNSGVLSGDGRITGALTNNASGQVRLEIGQQLHFNTTSTSSNAGRIEVIEGEIEFDGALTNAASTGLIAARDAALRFNAGLTNSGSVALSFGTSDVYGDIANTGSIVVSGGAAATFYDDVIQNGTMRVSKVGSSTSVAVFLGSFTGSGGSSGGGDIFFEGDLRPGNSAASVTFGNNIGFGSATILQIELGGTSPGTQYDQLRVTGALTLDGTLEVRLIDGFSPQAGQLFDILDWATISGTFDSLVLPVLTGDLTWNTSQLYSSGFLSVVLPGDFNLDGSVDAADYVVWRKTIGTQDAYNVWRANFGATAGGGSGSRVDSLSQSNVPEPTSVVLTLLGLFSAMGARRPDILPS